MLFHGSEGIEHHGTYNINGIKRGVASGGRIMRRISMQCTI